MSSRKPIDSISSASSSTNVEMRLAVERAAADVVEHAARRADDDVHAVLERCDLLADRRAAVDGPTTMPRCLPMLRQLARDLQRELARRREDQRLRLALVGHALTIGSPNAVVLPVPVRTGR